MSNILISATLVIGTTIALIIFRAFTHISLRKILHISLGPVFYFPLRYEKFTLKTAILASIIPLTGSFVFFSAWLFNVKYLLDIITRKNKAQVSGVVQYGILWAFLPFYMMLDKEHLLIPGLVNMTLGDGFAGCMTVFSHLLPPRNNGKTLMGSLVYLVSSALGMTFLGYTISYSLLVSICGMFVEISVHDDDNVYIVGACFILALLMELLIK